MARFEGDTLPDFSPGHTLGTKLGTVMQRGSRGRWYDAGKGPDPELHGPVTPDDGKPGTVLEATLGGYFVKSRTSDDVWWLVYERDCSCPAGASGNERCWHRSQVAEFVKRLDQAMRRPVAPPHPGFFE